MGLRQGCLLSPILFDIFINELGKEINKLGRGVHCGNRKLSLLCFADDIVLIADNRADLEDAKNRLRFQHKVAHQIQSGEMWGGSF